MNGDAADAYVRELAGTLDDRHRTRALSRLCIDLGADLGAFDRPMPTYLHLLAAEAGAGGARAAAVDGYWTGAMVAVGGVAAGFALRDARDRGRLKARDGLTDLYGAARQAGRDLAAVLPFKARRTIAAFSADAGPGRGAADAVRLIVDGFEGGVGDWTDRVRDMDVLPLAVSMVLLVRPLSIDGFVGVFAPPPDAGEPEPDRDALTDQVSGAVETLQVQKRVTYDRAVLKMEYGRVFPPDTLGLSPLGRQCMAGYVKGRWTDSQAGGMNGKKVGRSMRQKVGARSG